MPSKTDEQALEAAIEKALTGTNREELKAAENQAQEERARYATGNGYYLGHSADFDAEYALDTVRFWHFLESTQPKELEKLQRAPDWKLKILQRYDRLVKKNGILSVIRKGLDLDDAHLTLLYELPMPSSSQAVKDNFEKNEFSVTRQVRYSRANPRQEIDMVIFVNGMAIATLELKNPWTGQRASVEGINQYKKDRDHLQPLLSFGRCVVHMTVDTDEAYMTTKLAGAKTRFLPFNKGHNHSKGNPPNMNGHKTAYLWEDIFTRESLANILQHFVRLGGKPSDPLAKRTLFFPRYHQREVVRKILGHAAEKGVGPTYLIQHSAGSGKSNSITWAAYQLIETYPKKEGLPGAKGMEEPLFDSVIVVTDRRLLDKQIRENIRQFSRMKNIVAPAHSSKELKQSLEQGKKIIITTIQKFPFIVEGIADLSEKRFAVIIDEAHSSQSGTAAGKMNQAMGMGAKEEGLEDAQDIVLQALRGRKMRDNASYMAFTATPKNTTLERFGTRKEDGSFEPFHLYSMKQAIEEEFILDVLANYTTYKSYYQIQKSIEDNPLFDTKKAQKKLRAYVERDKHTIGTKATVMIEHFFENVYQSKRLKGQAKGMVLTQDIESAIRYYLAIRGKLEEKGSPFKVLIAFSGKKMVDGIEYSEADLNGFAEKDTRDKFDTDAYRLLIVANKYLTGFDQPKLSTMYVDKKLQGVLAVQALSRLNRAAKDLGKRSEDLFVLDFFNEVEDIKAAFDPFYTATSLSRATDVNVLHELRDHLQEPGVFEWDEVVTFADKYFGGVDAEKLSPIIDTAADRFNHELGLEDEGKADFKIKAKQFVKIYSNVSSIIYIEMEDWERLFWFLKFLIPKLVVVSKDNEAIDEVLENVDLATYGLQRTKLKYTIKLEEEESEVDPQNANPRGAHGSEDEKNPLDEIIKSFNERWFHGWEASPKDQQAMVWRTSQKLIEHPDLEEKYLNNPDSHNRNIAIEKILHEVLRKERKQQLELYKLTANDEAFFHSFLDLMKRMVDNPGKQPGT